MVSSFMNNLSYHFCKDFNKSDLQNKDNIIERFFNLFDHNYSFYNVDYFKEIYNLKINYDSFDFENKYLFHRDESITYLKLRLCDSNLWDKIFKKIFGWNIKIVKHNETEKKNIGKIYNYFKDNYTISTKDMDILENNEFFNFYFSEEEQKLYLKNFSDKINDNKIYPKFSTHELSLYFYMLNENDFLSLVIKQISDSNSTLVLNCLCNTCKLKRFNLRS
jgi:nucleoside diphosphate kinase